jgi:hypothetical protein
MVSAGSALSRDWQVANPIVDNNRMKPNNCLKNLDMAKYLVLASLIKQKVNLEQLIQAERYHIALEVTAKAGNCSGLSPVCHRNDSYLIDYFDQGSG